MYVLGLVAQSCLTLCNPMNSSVAHQAPLSMGILQARTLEWVAMPSSRGSSRPRDGTQVSHVASGFYCLGHQGGLYICIANLKCVNFRCIQNDSDRHTQTHTHIHILFY